ncbi:hypothetical protein AUP68_15747 [Ilyonectria robusta]
MIKRGLTRTSDTQSQQPPNGVESSILHNPRSPASASSVPKTTAAQARSQISPSASKSVNKQVEPYRLASAELPI